MNFGLWEIFRERLIAAYAPDEESVIGRLIAEADVLEAEKATLQKPYTAAANRVRELETVILKPRTPNVRLAAPEAADLQQHAAELVETRQTLEQLAHGLTRRTARVRDIQSEIGSLLLDTTIEEEAKRRERERLLRA